MEDDFTNPPENPPGEPSADLAPGTDQPSPKSDPKPETPSFSTEQLTQAVGLGVKEAFKQVFPTQPSSTAADLPSGPSPADLQAKIDEVDTQIDLAVQDGRPSSEIRQLNKRRDQLRDDKFDIERVQPLRAQGSQGINDLVINNLRLSDPLFEKYEQEFRDLVGPSMKAGQVLTMKIAEEGFALVKGRHLKEIMAADRDATARQEKLRTDANLPGGTSGRTIATQPKQPDTIKELFGDRADEAFRAKKNKGMDEDEFARKQGFANKADWFKKTQELDNSDRSLGLDR